jgi:hypothetical protein
MTTFLKDKQMDESNVQAADRNDKTDENRGKDLRRPYFDHRSMLTMYVSSTSLASTFSPVR